MLFFVELYYYCYGDVDVLYDGLCMLGIDGIGLGLGIVSGIGNAVDIPKSFNLYLLITLYCI